MLSGRSKSRFWMAVAVGLMAAGLLWAWTVGRAPQQRRPGRLVRAEAVLAHPCMEGLAWVSLRS